MKKILFIAALAATVMSSCSNEDDLTGSTANVTDNNEIAFVTNNQAMAQTRSVTTSLTDFYVTAVTEDNEHYIERARMALSSGTFKSTNTKLYWPTTGKLNFYALNALMPIKYNENGVPQHTFTGVDGDKDYVAAVSANTSKVSVVPLTFNHIMTRVGVTVTMNNDLLDYKLKSIKAVDIRNGGVYTFGTTTGDYGSWTWDENQYRTYEWTTNLPCEIRQGQEEYVGTQFFNVIPQKSTPTFTLEYEVYQNGVLIADYTGSNAREVDVNVDWSPGQVINYIFYLDANEDELRFSATVNPWSTSDDEDVDYWN